MAPATTDRAGPIIAGFLLCIFAIGTAELLVGGLLPQIAAAVHVSMASAGQLVTAYALGVVVGGPLITVLTARLPRKGLVLGLIALFIAGSLVSAAATSYGLLAASRVLAALSQARCSPSPWSWSRPSCHPSAPAAPSPSWSPG